MIIFHVSSTASNPAHKTDACVFLHTKIVCPVQVMTISTYCTKVKWSLTAIFMGMFSHLFYIFNYKGNPSIASLNAYLNLWYLFWYFMGWAECPLCSHKGIIAPPDVRFVSCGETAVKSELFDCRLIYIMQQYSDVLIRFLGNSINYHSCFLYVFYLEYCYTI